MASWLPHIPDVKERLALGDFQLGIALFAMAAGSGDCAALATTGYAGLLSGPPLIGMTAELAGLCLALVIILLGVLAIAVFAGLVREKAGRCLPVSH